MNKPTSLYRHFASDGTLLYVGISLSWPARTRAHAHYSAWFEQVCRVEIEQFPSREAALNAERDAIKSERPKFNVVHNQTDSTPRRPRLRPCPDPLFGSIVGPHAIVGPALVYRENKISIMVAHGELGAPGELAEIVLGDYFPDLPDWTDCLDTVLTIRGADEITLLEARERRSDVLKRLRAHLREVQALNSDLAFAVAYASDFPSAKSRAILDEVASEKRVEAR